MKIIQLIILILLQIHQLLSNCNKENEVNQCIQLIDNQINSCNNNNLQCECNLMPKKMQCYDQCKMDENIMEMKAKLVTKYQKQCKEELKSNFEEINQKLNKLVQSSPTQINESNSKGSDRGIYYNVNEFPQATDPASKYNTVEVYQSMPPPGAYKNQISNAKSADRFSLLIANVIILRLFN